MMNKLRYIVRTEHMVSFHESVNSTVTISISDEWMIEREVIVIPLWMLVDLSYELKVMMASRRIMNEGQSSEAID